jgi:branched-chain amino acid transport system substrate-binding protein
MRRFVLAFIAGLFLLGILPTLAPAEAETVPIRFGGLWVQSGIFKSFGVNSRAVYEAFVDELHANGGIKLKDGRIGRIETKIYDSACNAEQGIALVRKMAARDKLLLAVGPSCSSVAEPVFGILQKRLDDPSDTGLQFMVFSDTSIKTRTPQGLTRR